MRCSEHLHCRGLGYRNSRVEEAIESLVLSARDCEAGVMRIFPGYDSRSPTLQKSPLVGDCMRGIIDDKFRTAYIDRAAQIFSADLVQLGIRYDDGSITHILKELRVTRDGRWWAFCANGVFQLGTLIQPTTIEKVVALTTEVLVDNPSWPLRGASPETVAHFADLARDVMSEWATLGHIEGERFPGLDAVNYYSPTYRAPLCCPK